ncbi:MAG: hypothetical protein J5382_09660 [Bacteroidales bacterium]|nr:hypothetical protein [Bacteroidales bacterium]
MNTEELKRLSPLDLMLAWNRYCDTHNREGDCILLNEDRTYVEAFADEEEAMKEILNSGGNDFKRNEGYLIPLYYDNGSYKGMEWVPEEDIWDYVDFDLMAD